MQNLSAAIVGTGFMGKAHVEALRRLRVNVKGILGHSPPKTRSASRQLGIDVCYDSFDDVCQDDDVDVIHLCTPHHLHHQMAKKALLAGKHVFCEKPLATSSRQAYELLQLMRSTNHVGAVNYSARYYALNQEARVRVQAGQIGEPRILKGDFSQDWLLYPTDWNWRVTQEEGGRLRVVGDIGTHVMDMLSWLTNLSITAVMADIATFVPIRQRLLEAQDEIEDIAIETEDYACVMLHFSNGARGVVTLSQISPGRKNRFLWEVHGSQASLSWCQERPNELWIGHREKPNEILIKDPTLMQPDAQKYAAYPAGHAEGYPDSFARHFEEVYTYIDTANFQQPPPFPTFKDGWKEMVLIEAILQSVEERSWVDVNYNEPA